MSNILKYKEYIAKIEFSAEDFILYGKIEGIKDLVTFESASAETIEKEFQEAVDDYIAYCEEIGKEPDKPFKGSFNVRVSPELHKAIVMKAAQEGKTLNTYVSEALGKTIEKKAMPSIVINFHQTNAIQKTVADFNIRTNNSSEQKTLSEFEDNYNWFPGRRHINA